MPIKEHWFNKGWCMLCGAWEPNESECRNEAARDGVKLAEKTLAAAVAAYVPATVKRTKVEI
jgi:ribosomal protein L40E